MLNRNSKAHDDKEPPRKKIRFSVDISKDSVKSDYEIDDCQLIDIPDLTGINMDQIEKTIYEAIRKNNISSAKAKYLIRKMLKHPIVVEWFQNLFNSDNHQFNLLYEPPVTRSSKKRMQDDEDPILSSLDANLIGKLLLSRPTINSSEFENEDHNDNDYLPESEYSNDSDQSSLVSDIGNNKTDQVILSPYCTRSKVTLSDIEVNLLDDSSVQETDEAVFMENVSIHEPLSLEEMHNLMEIDVDDQRYEEFKQSLRMDDLKFDEPEDESDFDVLAELDDLEDEIFDEIRDDRSVKISRSELWGLLEDSKLVKGNGNSSCAVKKSKTMLCEENEVAMGESCCNVQEKLLELKFSVEQRDRLCRQIIMFYQQLATAFIMTYDQPHLKSITEAQMSYYFHMTRNLSIDRQIDNERSVFDPQNRCVVEKILFNYRGISYIPTNRFNDSVVFRKIDFPKCVMATLLCSPAFPYLQLLPTSFKLYNHIPADHFRQIPFLPSEDKLLTMGIIQFSHQCHKMLKLIKKYLFPIRSTDQLRNRKTNIIRRQKELNHKDSEMFAEVLQSMGYMNVNKKNLLKVYSDLAQLPVHVTPIWQRKEEWKFLVDIYKSFLTKTVPNIMYNLHLCTKEEWSRANRIATNRKAQPNKEFQFCNWSSLPWELERTDLVRQDNKKGGYPRIVGCSNTGSCVSGGGLRKVVNKKSFPQYEVPKNSNLKEFLKKWNYNCDKDVNIGTTSKTKLNENNLIIPNDKKNSYGSRKKFIYLRKVVKRAKRFFLNWNAKRDQKKLKTEQSYAHYFRNDNVKNLFPITAFKSRLDECISMKESKNHRLQRFQNKCRDKEFDIIDFTSVSFSNQDEVDLIFSRNLLSSLRNNLNAETYERCLDKINEFHSKENDVNFDESAMELMKYLMTITKSETLDINIYEDLLSLLTFRQAMKLGCEIDWCHIRNINRFYMSIKSLNIAHKRRFWVRLSSLIHKSKDGYDSLAKVIQYLHASLKTNPYLQSQIAPLLNCWETPFPNYPQSFANFDTLSSNQSAADFCKDSERDCFEYFTELAEQPKTTCACSCHDNGNNGNTVHNNSTAIVSASRHCIGCSLKVCNGCIYLDDSRFHKRLITINLPSSFKPASKEKKDVFHEDYVKITNQKLDVINSSSISVVDFLKSKTSTSIKQIHNRCITIKEIQNRELISKGSDSHGSKSPPILASSMHYSQVLADNEAAMDADVFQQIKGQKYSLTGGYYGAASNTINDGCCTNLQIPTFESTVRCDSTIASLSPQWTDDDNLLLLKLCQKHGPTTSTFLYLQGAHFSERSLVQIEDQFNYLFQKVLEYQQRL